MSNDTYKAVMLPTAQMARAIDRRTCAERTVTSRFHTLSSDVRGPRRAASCCKNRRRLLPDKQATDRDHTYVEDRVAVDMSMRTCCAPKRRAH